MSLTIEQVRTLAVTVSVSAVLIYIWYTDHLVLPSLQQLHNQSLSLYSQWRSTNQTRPLIMTKQAYSDDWLIWLQNSTVNGSLQATAGTDIQPSLYWGIHRLPALSYALAVYIRTGANEVAMRKAIRDTWMGEAKALGMTVLFVAAPTLNASLNSALRSEAHLHRDMLVLNSFIDAYHNLSLKTREIMRWHQANTDPQVPTVFLWTNIDGMLFPQNLLQYINQAKVATNTAAVYGQCTCSGLCRQRNGPKPQRGPNDKWGIPRSVYPWDNYPHYCMGYSILMAPGTVPALLQQANNKTERWLMDNWIDDVTFTGILVQESLVPIKLHGSGMFPGAEQPNGCGKCVAMHIAQSAHNIRKHHDNYKRYLARTGRGMLAWMRKKLR